MVMEVKREFDESIGLTYKHAQEFYNSIELEKHLKNFINFQTKEKLSMTINLSSNLMLKTAPELFVFWDFKKNTENGLDIYKITKASEKKPWWYCPFCDKSYQSYVFQKVKNNGHLYCSIKKLKHTESLFFTEPQLSKQWHPFKNNEINLLDITKNQTKVWWICEKCKESYFSSILSKIRTTTTGGCPYCSGKKANSSNSLATLFPEVAAEWHPTKNGSLTPHDVTSKRATKVWWLGKCGHEWDAVIHSRTNGLKCPICSNQRVLKGYNDIWSTNPELASLLANPEDGYKYTQMSKRKVDWKCKDCGNIIKNKSIQNINIRTFKCICSDSISFGEKFVYYLLKDCGVEFLFDETQKWSKRKRYDFYFEREGESYIIEVHGLQHYKVSFEHIGHNARTLKEEQENDSLKKNMAKKNKIDNYIVIDARYSSVEWIKNSILNSDTMNIIGFRDIDFERLGELAASSMVKVVCDLWNSKTLSMGQLAKEVSLSNATVISYLIRGNEIGWCNYITGNRKPVVQLGKNMDFIREWGSSQEAGDSLGFNGGLISGVCNGIRKTAKGFRWMFKEDYEEFLSGNVTVPPLVSKLAKSVVQLDEEHNKIGTFLSQSEATTAVGLPRSSTSISNVCRGRTKTSCGFKWMYEVDYDKMVQEGLTHEEYMNKYYPKTK